MQNVVIVLAHDIQFRYHYTFIYINIRYFQVRLWTVQVVFVIKVEDHTKEKEREYPNIILPLVAVVLCFPTTPWS